MNKEELEENNYKEYRPNHYQKCIRDNIGKRYFINIEYFQPIIYIPIYVSAVKCKVQFQNVQHHKKEVCMNIEFDCMNLAVNEMEQLINKQWIAFNKPYYCKF